MDSLSALDPLAWNPDALKLHPAYAIGNAIGWLSRGTKQAAASYPLAGRLYLAKSGWLFLSVPNALVRGVYDAMSAPGAELPTAGAWAIGDKPELLNAHISVMTADEVNKIGADKINERGHMFGYTLNGLKEIAPSNAGNISKVWAIQVSAPGLSALRKSYGLSALPNDDHPFHITVAVRRRGVLLDNGMAKGYDTPTEVPAGESFAHPISRGELKAAAAESSEKVDYECSCSGRCLCPDNCVCKKYGTCGGNKTAAAEELPWRDRVEILTKHPTSGKIYGGVWDNDKSFAAPGGGIDPGETPEQAAVRELEEETGIQAANPVLLPIQPVKNPWSDEYRARTGRNFAGSRTHFVVADFVRKLRRKNLDVWNANNRRFYRPEHALELMQNKTLPSVGEARMRAIQHVIDSAAMKTAAADKLPGGEADNMPDSEFSPKALAAGATHEHEHTDNDQIAKEIAKDHLSEDPRYYQKIRQIEPGEKQAERAILTALRQAKAHSDAKRYDHKNEILRQLIAEAPQDWEIDDPKPAHPGITHKPTKFRFHADRSVTTPLVKSAVGSVYGNELMNTLSLRRPIVYDADKPVFENIKNQAAEIQRRSNFILQAKRNQHLYRAAIDPRYRYQQALKAFHGQLEQPALVDHLMEQYGDSMLGALGSRRP